MESWLSYAILQFLSKVWVRVNLRSIYAIFMTVSLAGVAYQTHAAGEFYGQAGFDRWSSEYAGLGNSIVNEDSIKGFAELHWNSKWSVRGRIQSVDAYDLGYSDSEHMSVDLKRRFFSLSEKNYVALGAGWEEITLDDTDTYSGLRLSAEGQLELGDDLSVYGQTSWLPELDDAISGANLEGRAFEAGFNFAPAPSLSVRFGYRRFRLDVGDHTGSGQTRESDGFIFGAGYHW